MKAANGYAYITDAAKQELVIVDLLGDQEPQRIPLEMKPVEMAVL